MRPIKDEYIDSSHSEPGETGGIRPAIAINPATEATSVTTGATVPLGYVWPRNKNFLVGGFVQTYRETRSGADGINAPGMQGGSPPVITHAPDDDDHVDLDLYSLFIGFMLGAALLGVAVCVGASI